MRTTQIPTKELTKEQRDILFSGGAIILRGIGKVCWLGVVEDLSRFPLREGYIRVECMKGSRR